ncbi:alpha/beta hydrolase [Sciscionella sediminilitoris]|uniref:alpha/beta hydrolase n=1 Tax=Sciscionella sediminilitoris TaxID=1445613 RepID=UPI0004DF851F|nr:alpha/beta hydrolase family protein [Sciscionella sp. SE31]
MRRITMACRVALTALLIVLLAAPGTASAVTPRSANGAHVVTQKWLGDRTMDLTISSTALGRDAMVRLIVPPGWSPESGRSWPVVYLLHGANDDADYTAWTKYTDIQRFARDKNVIIAMPTADTFGFYSDWLHGKPAWQTFHLDELPQILERGYHASDQRAIAGLSMGGFGAMRYAELRPGMFSAAASYSGLLDTTFPAVPQALQLLMFARGLDPNALWGDPNRESAIWQRNNPIAHLGELRGTRLFFSSGNGKPGKLDRPGKGFDLVEAVMGTVTKMFTDSLHKAGIPATTELYGNGTHDWPYWQRELHRSWPLLTEGFTR